jgi:hypothetical protein
MPSGACLLKHPFLPSQVLVPVGRAIRPLS